LNALIEEQIDVQLQQYAGIMTPEQLKQQKENLVAQVTSPQRKLEYLQGMMMEQALYREALAQELDEDIKIKRQLRRLTQQFLAQQLLEKEVAPRINITESDMETYYQANMDQYIRPPQARISHIQLAEKEQAQQVIERLDQGESFAELARELSLDENTKQDGGVITGEIVAGQYVPGIGQSGILEEKVFLSDPNTVLDEPIEGENGWHVILVRSVTDYQQRTFEEAAPEIYSTLYNQKKQELQRQLAEQLMDKYEIVIHREAVLGKQTLKKDF